MLPYLHPLLAVLMLALLAYVASLGVRGRNDRRRGRRELRRHARIAPWMFAGVVLTWAAGLATTWFVRPADELAASGHFKVGTAFVVVLALGALSSRWNHLPAVRRIHPWIGAAALLLSAAQAFFGLQILP